MPAPISSTRRYSPGLDGLRAVAVLGVLAYHLGFAKAQGGLLGVGVFFTLSGYLITDILLTQLDRGGIGLKGFYLARARRLLPALFLVLVVVAAWVTVIGPQQPGSFRGAVASGAFYFNNWWQIAQESSYFARFQAPGPLNHLWSLSVEEQFYIVWPLVLIGGAKLFPKLSNGKPHRLFAALTMGLALVSAGIMAALYTPGVDPSRIYYGTDTRALELLVGAALAMVWRSRRLRDEIDPGRRNLLDLTGLVGLAVIAVMFWRTTEFEPFLYRGGFVLLAVAAAAAVAALVHPATRLGPLLGCAPMRWIGERSYGIYLWHFPIIVLTTDGGVADGTDKPLIALQVLATFAAAALSWRYLENPIRHGAIGRIWGVVRGGGWRRPLARLPKPAWIGVAAAAAVFAAAVAGMAGANQKPESNAPQAKPYTLAETVKSPGPAPGKPRAACKGVVHIGDSTSIASVSEEYLPEDELIQTQYGLVGATTEHLEVSGGRSIAEPFDGPVPNGEAVAEQWVDGGFDGCWVLALGLNEAGNVAVGSQVGHAERIDLMMKALGPDARVLWVDVKTVTDTGPYSEVSVGAWNTALRGACTKYPNMRIYDWAADAPDDFFGPDGAHYTSEGDAAHSSYIAEAMLRAFPGRGSGLKPETACQFDLPGVSATG